eukprot:GEMP01001728.1.p1 GENE.GEMP01001728.1~~GEMP01001728.1.p1  ORF type:complete len:818 (+),score=93.25 GEMP01001728.1:2094-4547(+)
MFRDSTGHWNAMDQLLSLQTLSDGKIPGGQKTQFFLEEDQKFYLPFSLEKNDRSLFMYIPEAGIAKHFFDFTTRVNRLSKEFIVSELRYGEEGSVAYPYSNTQILIYFRTNIDLPQGTIIRIYLPQFRSANEQVPLQATVNYDLEAASYKNFKYDDKLGIWYAKWTQATQTLDLEVEQGRYISKDVQTEVRLPKIAGGFTLPRGLQPNDESLEIETLNNQIIARKPIRKSPLVVDRKFNTSSLVYTPNEKEGHFLFKMTLMPTVDIGADHTIFLTLPGFTNVLGKANIHLTGTSAHLLLRSSALWVENTTTLSFAPFGNLVLKAFDSIELEIQESQGFVLPSKLRRNDPTLMIYSMNNILQEPIKESMLVGSGPDKKQRVCAYQSETGVRTRNPYCENLNCPTKSIDACSKIELEKCGCNSFLTMTPVPLVISGFQFMPEDSIHFVQIAETCNDETKFLELADKGDTTTTISADTDTFGLHGLATSRTGNYRICFQHRGLIEDIGIITIRAVCKSPLVLVGNTCVSNCPKTRIPIFGECQRDLVDEKVQVDTKQALMVTMIMMNPDAVDFRVWEKYIDSGRTHERTERAYFEYRFKYEVARILDATPSRFSVASISKGPTNLTFYVNVVFKPQPQEDFALGRGHRSPHGLYSLFRALKDDYTSIMWQTGDFFRFIDRDFDIRAIEVTRCADGKYRTRCPYVPIVKDLSHITQVFFLVVFGIIFLVLLIVGLLWKLDHESLPNVTKAKVISSFVLDPTTKAEFARSWVESRYPGTRRDGFTLTKDKSKLRLKPKRADMVSVFKMPEETPNNYLNCPSK